MRPDSCQVPRNRQQRRGYRGLPSDLTGLRQSRPDGRLPGFAQMLMPGQRVDADADSCARAFMRTSLDLPDPLFRAVKMRAVREGVTFKELAARYLAARLEGTIGESPREPEGDRPPLPVAIPRRQGSPRHPALSNVVLEALLVAEDQAPFPSDPSPGEAES